MTDCAEEFDEFKFLSSDPVTTREPDVTGCYLAMEEIGKRYGVSAVMSAAITLVINCKPQINDKESANNIAELLLKVSAQYFNVAI